MSDALQIANLQRRKQGTLAVLIITSFALASVALLRFIPRLDDLASGQPKYAKTMTTLMAQEFGNVAQGRFPVLLRGENDSCGPVPPVKIADDQIAGILYIFTYSERNRFSCITSYAVPVDPSKFADLITLELGAEWATGPKIERPIRAIPVARNLHIYPAAYLASLHWRVTPRFPISEDEAANLAAQHYESRNPAVPSDEQANIHIDFDKARALVRQPHDRLNFQLSLAIAVLGCLLFSAVFLLLGLYKKCAFFLRPYGQEMSISPFIFEDINQKLTFARTKHFEEEQERQAQRRRNEIESSIRQELEERLRSALGNLHDENLRQKVTDCLKTQLTDVDHMKQLWAELQESFGHKMPEERLTLLLESLKPYCTEEEFSVCRLEAAGILAELGFRTARNYVVAMHDQFRLRIKKLEEREENKDTGTTG